MVKVWFITGCSTGFGKLLAQELLKTSAQVVATARNEAALVDLKGINDKNLLTLPLDVTKPEQISAALEKVKAKFGRVDVLVNNAGYGMVGAVEESDMASIQRMFNTNVFGLMAVTQATLPIMRAQKSGHIINLSSAAGVVGTPGFGIYNSTKFAVEGMSEALAGEVAHLGIKVTIIEPGPFRTDFAGRSLDTMEKIIPDYADSVGKTREFIANIEGKQAGDPVKAVKMIIELVENEKPPLRLPMGNWAVDRIKAKIAHWGKEVESLEQWARSADFS